MSLKGFHILFVVLSVLLTLGFGIWSLRSYGASHAAADLVWGLVALAACAGLLVYGVKFLKKLKREGI